MSIESPNTTSIVCWFFAPINHKAGNVSPPPMPGWNQQSLLGTSIEGRGGDKNPANCDRLLGHLNSEMNKMLPSLYVFVFTSRSIAAAVCAGQLKPGQHSEYRGKAGKAGVSWESRGKQGKAGAEHLYCSANKCAHR